MNPTTHHVARTDNQPQRSPLDAVAAIGTLVASAGVAHAMYAALAADRPGLHVFALMEALTAALFLDLVVATCARRAKAHARDAHAARLDVAVVLAAAVLSGMVSGIHAGWSVAGLFRFAVPTIAALVWLGDTVSLLRSRRETDHERALRAVLTAVGQHTAAADTRGGQWLRAWRVRRADVQLVRAMSVYAAADGEREQLVRRVNEVHHRGDLLAPLGPSPWQVPRPEVDPLPLPRALPALWAFPLGTPALTAADSDSHTAPDPLLPTVKALIAGAPTTGRKRLIQLLREQGHAVGTQRATALLRAAKSSAPAVRVNGTGQARA